MENQIVPTASGLKINGSIFKELDSVLMTSYNSFYFGNSFMRSDNTFKRSCNITELVFV